MKVQAIQDGAMSSYAQVVTQGHHKDFGQLLEGLQQVTEQLMSEQSVETRELSFRDMIDIELTFRTLTTFPCADFFVVLSARSGDQHS